MSEGIAGLFEKAERLADAGRLVPALEVIDTAARLTRIPARRALARYNRGAIYWHRLGDGVAARREFRAAIDEFDTHGYGEQPQIKVLHANALENLMLCALSFKEFERLAARLDALAPGLPILVGLRPEIRTWRERGDSWAGRLFALAGTYYNRNDPRRDVGRYGSAKSTYHLLLVHRRDLRLAREDWRLGLFEYCTLCMRMAADCMRARGGDNDPNPPDEFLTILTDAIPMLDEYLTVTTGDDAMREILGNLQFMVTNCRERWASLQESRSQIDTRTESQDCRQCGTVYSRANSMTWLPAVGNLSMICPRCGGDVVWQSNADQESRSGCPLLVIAVVAAAGAALGLWVPW